MIFGEISEKIWWLPTVIPTTYWGIRMVQYSDYSITSPLTPCLAIGIVLVAIQAFYNYQLKIDLPDYQIQTHPEQWGTIKWFFIGISWVYSLLTLYVLSKPPIDGVAFIFLGVYAVGLIIFGLIGAFIFKTFMKPYLKDLNEEMNKNKNR